jgi:hypothetical protein
MTNILAILILASGFSVAIETKGGFIEKTFENTTAGAEEFREFAEPLIRAEGKSVKICMVKLVDDPGPIFTWLLEEDLRPASISTHAFREYVAANAQSQESASVVAKACLDTFPFIRRAL